MEENYTPVNSEATEEKLSKTWSFTEKNNKHTTYHTFTIQGKRFSHQAELREAAQSYRQRTDFNLDNVYAVNSYYGVTRNLVGTVILAILAAIAGICSLGIFAKGGAVDMVYDYELRKYVWRQIRKILAPIGTRTVKIAYVEVEGYDWGMTERKG